MDDVDEQVIEVETKRKPGKRMTFRIGGELYRFKVPKLYGLIDTVKEIRAQRSSQDESGLNDVAMFDKIERWLFESMDPEDADELKARLKDPDDEVDVEHVVEVFQHLTKEAADRPSGPRRSG